jgi:hypothetical protein
MYSLNYDNNSQQDSQYQQGQYHLPNDFNTAQQPHQGPYQGYPQPNTFQQPPQGPYPLSNNSQPQGPVEEPKPEFAYNQIKDNKGPFLTGVILALIIPLAPFIPYFQKYPDRPQRRYLLTGASITAATLFLLMFILSIVLEDELLKECNGVELEKRFTGSSGIGSFFDFNGCTPLEVMAGIRIAELISGVLYGFVLMQLRLSEAKDNQNRTRVTAVQE